MKKIEQWIVSKICDCCGGNFRSFFVQFGIACFVAGAASAADWPADDSHYRSEGPFHTWSDTPNIPALDLAKLAGVTEVSQVVANGGGWVVLKPDGTTISNREWLEKEGVARMIPGFDQWLGLLTHSEELLVFNVNGPVDLASLSGDLPGMKVVDCYFAPSWGAVIDSEGGLHMWGKEFDGVNEPGNGEWKEKPTMPEGVRAVSLSGSAPGLCVMASDGVLRAWSSNGGSLSLADEFVAGGVVDFAQGPHFITRLSKNAEPVMDFHFRIPDKKPGKVHVGIEPVEVFTACEGIVLRAADGVLEFSGSLRQNSRELGEVLPLIRASSENAISIFRKYRGDDKWDMRVLWFDGQVTPVKVPTAPEITTAPAEPPAMPATSQVPASEESSLVAVPETPAIRTRVEAYQKARVGRLSEITGTYVGALEQAENLAQANGELDKLVRIRDGLKNAEELQLHFELLTGSTGIAPVGLPPVLAPPVDLPVRQARKEFETAFVAAERELAEALDQSLNFVQQNQVKDRKIAPAKVTRELREELTARFAAAFPKEEETRVALSENPPTVLEKALATTNQPVSKPTTKPGRLEVWSAKRDDDAIRETRARGFDDLIQVQLYKDGWIVLRENGEVIGSNRDHDRTGIVRFTKGWDNAFGMITEDGELLYFGPGKGRPPHRVRNVRDAFVCETHSIALHADGTITTWGPAYTSGDLDGQKWVPAPTGFSGIDRVIGSPWLALVIDGEGMVTAWRATGPCRMGRGATENVRDFSAKGKGFRFINKEGGMLWWRMSDSGANGYPDWRERYGDLEELLETQDANFARTKDGSIVTDLKWIERYPDFRRALEGNKGAPEEAFSFWSGGGRPHRFAWIESD